MKRGAFIVDATYVGARDADVAETGIPIIHRNRTLLWPLVLDDNSRQKGMVLQRTKRDQERVSTIVFAINDQFRLNYGMVGHLAQSTNPEFGRGLGG